MMRFEKLWLALPAWAVTVSASAQEAAKGASAAAEEAGGLSVVTDYLADGGTVMYVILGVSILGTVLFLERAFDLYVLRRLDAPTFVRNAVQMVERKDMNAALHACQVKSAHLLPQVLKAGMLRSNLRSQEVERAMETEIRAEIPALTKRVTFLSLLANAATLAGLLGTIFGLISAFNSVAMASAAQRQEALAGGISQAMYTTAFGISVALPMLFFHHFLSKRTERIVQEAEAGAGALMVALGAQHERPASRSNGASAGSVAMPASRATAAS